MPLHPPCGQPRRTGILLVLTTHDVEPCRPRGARGPLRCPGFDARGVQAACGLRRCLRALPESGAVSDTLRFAMVGTHRRYRPAGYEYRLTIELEVAVVGEI